jgi:PEP-CTERM motif
MARMPTLILAVAASAVVLGTSSAFAGPSFDFASYVGDTTPQTVAGSSANIGTATFSSPGDPGAYTFAANGGLYSNLGSYILTSAGFSGSELDITFSKPQTSVNFTYALADFFGLGGGDTISVSLDNGTPETFTAFVPDGDFYPEGSALLSSATAFSQVEITSDYGLTIADVSVPEPASMAVLGAGLAGLAAIRRRRRT